MQDTGLRVGLKNKGYKTDKVAPKSRPARRKGVRTAAPAHEGTSAARRLEMRPPSAPTAPPRPPRSPQHFHPRLYPPQILNKRVKVVREIISEVAGLAPYEKRVLDVIKVRTERSSAVQHNCARAGDVRARGCHARRSTVRASVRAHGAAIPARTPAHTPSPVLPAPPSPLLQTGGANAEKRSYKLAKQRLGTHKRALRKREQLKQLYAKQRAMK